MFKLMVEVFIQEVLKNKMVNATIVACEFQSMLPQDEQPCHTEVMKDFIM